MGGKERRREWQGSVEVQKQEGEGGRGGKGRVG